MVCHVKRCQLIDDSTAILCDGQLKNARGTVSVFVYVFFSKSSLIRLLDAFFLHGCKTMLTALT